MNPNLQGFLIFLASISPIWYLAQDIGSDEVKKTFIGAVGASTVAVLAFLKDRKK